MQFFITSTGTDIGKTFVLENLCKKLILSGQKVEAIKPIISGFSEDDLNSDSAKILKIFGQELTKNNLDKISPYRFSAPLSPNIAVDLEGQKQIDFLAVVKFCQNKIDEAKSHNSYLFIEGAGGVMTPINNDKTFADLIFELKIPAILVTGNYLGTISHTLTAIKAMQAHKIEIAKIIFNDAGTDLRVCAADNLKTLRNFTDIQIDEL